MSRNSNPILRTLRGNGYGDGDERFVTLEALFCIAEALTLADQDVPAEWEFTPSPLLPFGDGAYITEEYGWLGEEVWWTLHHCEDCEPYEVDREGWDVVLQAGRALNKLDNLFRLGGAE